MEMYRHWNFEKLSVTDVFSSGEDCQQQQKYFKSSGHGAGQQRIGIPVETEA